METSGKYGWMMGTLNWKVPLTVILFSLSLHADPITAMPQDWTSATPQASGYAQTLGNTIYFDLWNLPGDQHDQMVTLTFAEPVLGFGGWWDNRPQNPGTGICVLDDCFGDATAFVGFRGWVSDVPFQSVVIYTQMAHPGAIREHGLLTDIAVLPVTDIVITEEPGPIPGLDPPDQIIPLTPVPEPRSWMLAASGFGLFLWRRRRQSGQERAAAVMDRARASN